MTYDHEKWERVTSDVIRLRKQVTTIPMRWRGSGWSTEKVDELERYARRLQHRAGEPEIAAEEGKQIELF